MSVKDELDIDIRLFIKNVDKQLPEDNVKTLRLLMEKYIHLTTSVVLLDRTDFDSIKSHALHFYKESAFPKTVGTKRKEITTAEANILSIIEGTITVLGSKECLRKIPKFDYRDQK